MSLGITARAQIITTIAGNGTNGDTGDGGPATAASLSSYVMTMDNVDNLYIMNADTMRLRKINASSGIIYSIAGTGLHGYSGDGGPASAAMLMLNGGYSGIATDNSGNIYIATDTAASASSGKIRKINTSGIITAIAGSGTVGYGGDGGPATAAQLSYRPNGIYVDAGGNLYVCDNDNNRVRRIDTAGIITTFAGDGTIFSSGDGGPATVASIADPAHITGDRAGNIYVSTLDGTARVRKIDASGFISTVAGTGTSGHTGDGGPATAAEIYSTTYLAADGCGNLYVSGDNCIRKVDTHGIISTIAGNGTSSTYSGDGGPATAAGVQPTNINVDAYGNIFFQNGTTRIRRISTGNHAPAFTGGRSRHISVCNYSSTAYAINSLLAVCDSDNYQTETWAVLTAPTHGTLAGSYSATSTAGDTLLPTGLSYTPTVGYIGNDTFRITVTDCDMGADTIKVYVAAAASAPAITGAASVCVGYTTTLSDTAGIGSWSSSAMAVGIGSATGIATGNSTGMATISYIITSTCYSTLAMTANPMPAGITGTINVCAGQTTTLGSATTGGTWSSSNTAIATAGTASALTSIITGITAGADTINYTLPTGCAVNKVITVNSLPAAITGPGSVCVGATINLSDSVTGGTWSTGGSAGSIGSTSGTVTGTSAGTTIITYANSAGCRVTYVVTVNALPSPITGTMNVCAGITTILSNASTGGEWSTANASIGSISGITSSPSTATIAGVSAGTTSITYTLPTSCYSTAVVTVNPLPAAITGSFSTCMGIPLTLYDIGGIWSAAGTVASVGTATGIVTPLSAGIAAITYTLPTGCTTTATITINPNPGPITGTAATCYLSTTLLTDTTAGGTWYSSDYSTAYIVGSTGSLSTGTVTGYAAGTATISYMAADGCMATTIFTVNPAPGSVTGIFSLCTGSATTLTDTSGGGIWSAVAGGAASVGSATGIVTGASAGTTTISYTLPGTGCAASHAVTVLSPPPAIGGPASVCVGFTATETETTTGGTWSMSPTAIGTISSGGVVRGITTGTATVSYTSSGGCLATKTITVNTTPLPISGSLGVCRGSTTTLTDGTGGGTWSSGSLPIGTIGSVSGIVSGISTGTTIITYSLGLGCSTTAVVTVNSLPTAIGGPAAVCQYGNILLTDAGGGTWSSNNSNATVASGTVTGVATGTDVITYALPTGCFATKAITINALPGTIGGTASVCSGGSVTLTDGGIGTWGVSGPATIISGTGVLTAGSSSGTALVTYTLTGTGCATTTAITVNPLPTVISGAGSICPGGSITLSGPTGGVWSSGAGVPIAIGSATGIVTGTTAGTPTITYTLPTGCYRSAMVTINPTPPLPGGPSALCVGAHITLTESGSGTWLSGSTGVATIGTTTGNVTGIATGTSNITFTSAAGCPVSTTITVSLSPANISGPLTVCTGASVSLTDTAGGGLWSSGSGMATIGSLSGTVTGVSAGTVVITYSLGTGCTVTRTETVTASPAAILGAVTLCAGATTPLTETTTGGTWSSTPASVATVSGGTVSGIAAGTAVIDYTAGGCFASDTITVNATPVPITIGSGPAAVCQGATITATDAVAGGTWSTTSSSIMLGSSGSITGVTAGTASITYAIGSTGSLLSCSVTKTITVNPIAAITGATGICVGNTTTLSDAVAGGRWSSSGAGVPITIGSSTGVVTALSAGIANITYTTTAGCTANYSVTVNTTPSAIGGTLHLCVGSTTNLSNSAGGGVWTTTSSNIGLGSVSGIVTGITAGIAPVTYSLGTGCTVNAVVTVNNLPASITGAMNVCPGGTTTLSESGSGVWESGSLSYATIGTSTGIVTGVSAGPATISFTSALGCVATTIVTVNPLPDAITGTASICEGLTTTLSDAATGGAWSTGSTLIAIGGSISSPSCTVTAISAGTGIVTYTLPTGCATTTSIYVNAAPPPITGATAMCISSGITLSDAAPGGGWTTTSGSAVTIAGSTSSPSCVVTGVSLGTAVVSYTLGGCSAVTTVSVTSLPPNISGTAHLCVGITDTLTDAGGGIWTSSNPLIATIGSATGAVVGVIPGTLFISYSLGLGCTVSMPVTVNATPASITGPSVLCAGSTVTLHDATAGGIWSSGNTTLATIGSASSPLSTIVNGASGGTVNISYTSIATGCASVYPVAVIQVPAITGTHNICAWGDTMTVYDPLPGGSFTSTLVTVSDSGAVLSYAPGTAVITYTESHGCFATATITVNPLPGEITGSRDICAGATAVLSDTSIGGIWSLAPTLAGTISPTGVVSGIAAGTVVVSYTTSRYGCSQSMTVSVDAAPTSAGTITGSSNVCAGSSITLSNTTIGGIWSATTGGIATIGSATGVVIATTAGTAAISYTISNHCGSIATTKTVTVNADVTPTISISTPTDTLCAGSLAHFASVITNGGTAPAYIWRVNGGTTVFSSAYSYIPSNGDVVTATLTSDAPCAVPASVTSNTVTMTVNPQVIPVVVITATPPGTILTGAAKTLTATVSNGGDNPTYQWVLNGVVIPGATDSSYTATTFNDGDTVTCVVISSGVCGGNTAFSNKEGIVVYNNVGIKSLAPKEELAVYPNPNNGAFTIKGAIGNPDEEVNIVINDLLGQEVYRSVAIVSNGMLDAQVQLGKSVAHGMYLVSVHTATGVMVFHVVVEQ